MSGRRTTTLASSFGSSGGFDVDWDTTGSVDSHGGTIYAEYTT